MGGGALKMWAAQRVVDALEKLILMVEESKGGS